MVPTPSTATVAVLVVGVISVIVAGYISLKRLWTGGVHDQQPCLDDKTLHEIATRLGCDWVKLALELGFTMIRVQTIEKNHQNDIPRQGLEMLVTWKQAQSTSDEQQITTLCAVLRKIGRADIAGFLNESPQMYISTSVIVNGNENASLTNELLQVLAVGLQCSGRMMSALGNFFTSCGVRLELVTRGSVTFVVRIMSREGLNKLWSMYTTGELAKKLTEILITDELTTEDKSDLAIQATVLESDYEQACIFFDELEKVQQKGQEILDTPTICKIARGLGESWPKLALYLQMDKVQCEAIKEHHSEPWQQAEEMLVLWREDFEGDNPVEHVGKALMMMESEDLACTVATA